MRNQYFLILLIVSLFFIAGCYNDDSGETAREELLEELGIDEESELEPVLTFVAEVEEDEGTVAYGMEAGPIRICVGQSITFTSTSSDVPDGVGWIFEGGDPSRPDNADEVTITYNEEGNFGVIIFNAGDEDDIVDTDDPEDAILIENYISVEECETVCLLDKIETDDGLVTQYVYDANSRLVRVENSLNGDLQEYSIYDYDSNLRLQTIQFFTPDDQLLGVRNYGYNTEDQLIEERSENPNGSLVSEFTFTWDEGLVISAILEQPDGSGGSILTNISYTYDTDNANISMESFFQNGLFVGSIEYDHDENPKIESELPMQSFPEYYNANNITNAETKDAAGNILEQYAITYQYDLVSCDKPIQSSKVTTNANGSTTENNQFSFLKVEIPPF